MILKFKSNIKCQGCINNVTPVLNNIPEIQKWEVDLTHSERILTIEGDVEPQEIVDKLKAIGYDIKLKMDN